MSNQTLRTAGVSAARDYQDLPAWQKAVALAERVYGLSEDHAGLIAHIRNTALVVAASIAAASGRNNEFGMTDSYSKAQSANAELMTQLTLAQRLGYIDQDTAAEIIASLEEVSRLIVGLKHGLKVAAKDAERAERDQREAAAAEREERPRREFKSRDDRGGERPRREYKPRDGASEDRPRREFKPRDGAGEDRPRREYKPRDGAPSGDRKPYGDKKPYGDRKPYGDKKPYGDRKPGGGKPFRKPRD